MHLGEERGHRELGKSLEIAGNSCIKYEGIFLEPSLKIHWQHPSSEKWNDPMPGSRGNHFVKEYP